MPQFEYYCPVCDVKFSLFQSRSVAKWDLMSCPACGTRVNIVEPSDNHNDKAAVDLIIRGRGRG